MTGSPTGGTGSGAPEPGRAATSPAAPGDGLRRLAGALLRPVMPLLAARQGLRHADGLFHPPLPPGRPRTPAAKKLPMREITVTTSRDGLPLRGWVVPGRGPHTVIACHGMGRTKSMALGHIEMFHRAGYHVLAYDMRNHGESGHDRARGDMAERFTSDLLDVVRTVAADPELGGGEIALLGFSLSTWPSLWVPARSEVPVAAVICDSGPAYDVRGGLGHFAGLRRGQLPEELRGSFSFAVYQQVFQIMCMAKLAMRDWPPDLSSVPTRLMFIGSSEDTIVPPEQVERVARQYPGAEYWVASGALHMNGLRIVREEYRRRVLDFLAGAFADGPRAAAASGGAGASGDAGAAGAPGAPGVSGATGESAVPSGAAGAEGASGVSGASGASGAAGGPGAGRKSGASGESGATRASGGPGTRKAGRSGAGRPARAVTGG
ncbi:alpha/beta hydrolase [Streptomyces pactum]|uniref:alpha/beta hydrolase n=1 Tax=Streptomyces pactum TaxID=68249 RepID=UPI0036FB732C